MTEIIIPGRQHKLRRGVGYLLLGEASVSPTGSFDLRADDIDLTNTSGDVVGVTPLTMKFTSLGVDFRHTTSGSNFNTWVFRLRKNGTEIAEAIVDTTISDGTRNITVTEWAALPGGSVILDAGDYYDFNITKEDGTDDIEIVRLRACLEVAYL